MKLLVAQVLRCIAWQLDPRGEVQRARDRFRASISEYAEAEQELLEVVREHQ